MSLMAVFTSSFENGSSMSLMSHCGMGIASQLSSVVQAGDIFNDLLEVSLDNSFLTPSVWNYPAFWFSQSQRL
jgi:hypothetical protein